MAKTVPLTKVSISDSKRKAWISCSVAILCFNARLVIYLLCELKVTPSTAVEHWSDRAEVNVTHTNVNSSSLTAEVCLIEQTWLPLAAEVTGFNSLLNLPGCSRWMLMSASVTAAAPLSVICLSVPLCSLVLVTHIRTDVSGDLLLASDHELKRGTRLCSCANASSAFQTIC